MLTSEWQNSCKIVITLSLQSAATIFSWSNPIQKIIFPLASWSRMFGPKYVKSSCSTPALVAKWCTMSMEENSGEDSTSSHIVPRRELVKAGHEIRAAPSFLIVTQQLIARMLTSLPLKAFEISKHYSSCTTAELKPKTASTQIHESETSVNFILPTNDKMDI